ncbi:hypothetical protein D3C80_1107640 [compost metagenome]
MALLHALPVVARGDGLVVRLTTDGGRVEQDFSAHQRHAAGALREPLVPADADTDFGVTGLPHLEAGIARVEVVLLVVARAIRDMGFTINPEVAAVGVDDRDAVEARAPGQFEVADRQHHLQLFGELLEVRDSGIGFGRGGQLQVIRIGLLAEIRGFEQFLDQDDLRALAGGFTDQPFGGFEISLAIPGTRHLGGGDGYGTAHENLLNE